MNGIEAALVDGDSVLMALLPPFGPRARWTATVGVLKLAAGSELGVASSSLVFLDERGGEVGTLAGAFGLDAGQRLVGPLYELRRDERPRPAGAAAMRWTLDARRTPLVAATDAGADAGQLSSWCLPLHVPLREDRQLFVQFVNTSDRVIDRVEAIRAATLWVDGVAHPSVTGYHWDGRSDTPPSGIARQGFRLADFDGAPLLGQHELSLDMLGRRPVSRFVGLSGEPWLPPPPPGAPPVQR